MVHDTHYTPCGTDDSRAPRIALITQIYDVEMKTLRREQRRGLRHQVGPRLIRRIGHRRIQVNQELARKAIDGRRLAEGEPQSNSFFEHHSPGGNPFLTEQPDETRAAGMRPYIGM